MKDLADSRVYIVSCNEKWAHYLFDTPAAQVPDTDEAERKLFDSVHGNMFRCGIWQKSEGSVIALHSVSRIFDEQGKHCVTALGASEKPPAHGVASGKRAGKA